MGAPKCHNLQTRHRPSPSLHGHRAHLVHGGSHCAVVLSGRGQRKRGWGHSQGSTFSSEADLEIVIIIFKASKLSLAFFLTLSLHPSLKRWKFAFVPSPATLPLCIRPPLYPWNYLLAFSFSAGSLHATRWLALFHHIISPLQTSLSLSLSVPLSLKRLLHFAVWFCLHLSLHKCLSPSISLSSLLHMKSICPFIIWLVLFFDRSISKANTGVCVVSPVAQMGRRWRPRCFCSRHSSESHFLSLLTRSLMLTGSTPREKNCPIAMQNMLFCPLFHEECFSSLLVMNVSSLLISVYLSIYLSQESKMSLPTSSHALNRK